MKDFRDLKVWEKAHLLTMAVYSTTRGFSKDELFGLTSQMRRASASIGANIAEGCGRAGDGKLRRFLQIAMGSASELEFHLILAKGLKLASASDYRQLNDQVTEVKRMLASLIVKLKADC